jgi:MFS transporter, DHA3 family, macrolide efflux protein
MSVAGIIKVPMTLSGVYTLSGILFLLGALLIVPLFKIKEEGANLSMTEKQPQV